MAPIWRISPALFETIGRWIKQGSIICWVESWHYLGVFGPTPESAELSLRLEGAQVCGVGAPGQVLIPRGRVFHRIHDSQRQGHRELMQSLELR